MRYDIYVQKGLTEDQTPLTSESPQTDVSVSPKKAIGLSFGVQQVTAAANTAATVWAQERTAAGNERQALAIQNAAFAATIAITKLVLPKLSVINVISGGAQLVVANRQRKIENKNIEFRTQVQGPRVSRHQRGMSIYD